VLAARTRGPHEAFLDLGLVDRDLVGDRIASRPRAGAISRRFMIDILDGTMTL
jgi:hypothetical protein